MEIDSTPPATAMSMRSTMICLAAVAMVIRPDEHCRSMVMPGTVTGNPALSAAIRPIVCWPPWGSEHPRMQSSSSSGAVFARSTAAVRAWAAKASGWVSLNAPR